MTRIVRCCWLKKGSATTLTVIFGDFARASALGFSCPIGSVSTKAESRPLNPELSEFRVDTEILSDVDVGRFEGGI
jgi:hypothetical protein